MMPTFTMDDPPGIECPEMNCVIFGNTKKYKHHKGNLDFRELLRSMVLPLEDEENRVENCGSRLGSSNNCNVSIKNGGPKLAPRIQAALLIDRVIEEASKKFVFRVYDPKKCWYRQIIDHAELRPQISQVIRDRRKQMSKEQKQAEAASKKSNRKRQQGQQTGSRTAEYPSLVMGLDPRRLKRFKTDDTRNTCFGYNGC